MRQLPRPAGNPEPIEEAEYGSVNIKTLWRKLKQEPACFWLLCAYVFFEYVRPQSIYPVLDFLPWGKVLLLGAFASRFLHKDPKSLDNPLTFAQVGFFIAALASSLFADHPSLSFDRFVAFVNWLLLYMLFVWTLTTRFRFFIMMLLLLLASFKMSQHAAITWVRRGMTFEAWGISGGPGYFGNAADMGVQMLVFLPLALALILGCQRYWGRVKKAIFLLFPISALMAIMATGERGTMLGLAMMGLMTIMAGKQRLRKLIAIGLVGFAVFHIMPDQYKARFQTAGTDGTSQARLKYWARGIEMYQDHPVFGIGFNNWVNYYSMHYPGESLRGADHQEVAHSTPITVLAEMGTFGFVFFYGIAVSTIRTNMKTMRVAKSLPSQLWYYQAFALNIGLIGFLTASCFITEHEFPFLFVQSSLSAALYNVITKNVAQKKTRRQRAASANGMGAAQPSLN